MVLGFVVVDLGTVFCGIYEGSWQCPFFDRVFALEMVLYIYIYIYIKFVVIELDFWFLFSLSI